MNFVGTTDGEWLRTATIAAIFGFTAGVIVWARRSIWACYGFNCSWITVCRQTGAIGYLKEEKEKQSNNSRRGHVRTPAATPKAELTTINY